MLHPTVVVPNEFTDKRTPTSITFIGGLHREAEVLTVAKAYQDATDSARHWVAGESGRDRDEDISKILTSQVETMISA